LFEQNVAVSWNWHRAAFALVALLLSFAPSAQQLTNSTTETLGLTPGPYAVGFRLLADQDHSRPITGADAKTHARPMRIYVWYPARNVAKPLRFGRYAELSDDDVWPAEITGREREVLTFSRGPLARSLDPTALDALLRRPTLAAENARRAAGSFPLIVIGLGLYYESPITFAALGEYLAGRGFVVVTVPLIGTSSALVRIDAQDLETQVRDLEFAIARARQLPFVNPVRLGVVGFDMGGMAGVILAMRHPGVGAFASLDSGIVYPHPSGLPQASPSYDPLALRVPWLHAAPLRPVERPQDPSAKSLFDTAVYSNRYLLKTEGMGHVDFTSYALIDGRRAMPAYWGDPQADAARRHGIVAEYLVNFFAAFLRMDATSVGWLARDPQAVLPGSQMTIEHRAATPPSISYDELVQAIVDGKGEQAIEQLRVANAANALDQTHLERLAVSLLYTWGLTKESLPLLAFTAERYPASVQAQAMLVDAYVLLENYPAAIEILSAFVQQHPDNPGARARLDEVRKLQDREHK
jgi:pimeloyl-ACP methyl ester carboxylesterase